MSNKEVLITPVGRVAFYALDKKWSDGLYKVSILLDMEDKETKDFLAAMKKHKNMKSIKKEVVEDAEGNSKAVVKVITKTKFEPNITDDKGNIVSAPEHIYPFRDGEPCDDMRVRLAVSAYEFKHPELTGTALNLEGVTIVSLDKKERPEGDAGGEANSQVLELLRKSLGEARKDNNLDALKG